MIDVIIGQNAIGKSQYLRSKVLKIAKDTNAITNIVDTQYLKNIKFNEERIDLLEDITDAYDIFTDADDILNIQSDEIVTGRYFMTLVSMICKDSEYLYLDEPEYGLSSREIDYLAVFLNGVEDTFKEIEIVTHSDSLVLQLLNTKMYTVEYDDKSRQFVRIELKEDWHTVID